MTEKTRFVYNFFFVIEYFRFFFSVKIATPPEISHPFFPSNLPLKIAILSSPSFLKIWSETQAPSPQQKRGMHTMSVKVVVYT